MGVSPPAVSWMNLQTHYDLWVEREHLKGRLVEEVEVLDETG